MKSITLIALILLCLGCQQKTEQTTIQEEMKIRTVGESKGYTREPWQLDSIYKRLGVEDVSNDLNWKAAISPHDNYKFAGKLYHESLKGINAPNIILIGVAHRARNYGLQDKIIFGNFTHWQSPYGSLKVSALNHDIMDKLSIENFIVHDSMQVIEHSLEAIVPWLHKKQPELEIVPILVPYINYETIDRISDDLAKAVKAILKEKNWEYGKGLAVVISNDAVHYGDEQWSGNLAPYGVDDAGTEKARQRDLEIIDQALTNKLTPEKIKRFTEYTVQAEDYKEYKWVWCGRYSVPFGLSFANKLNLLVNNQALTGTSLGYQTSIDHELLYVEDLGMGSTSLTTQRHWVAYASLIYQ